MTLTVKDLVLIREHLLYLATSKDYKHRAKIATLIGQIEDELEHYKVHIRGPKQ